MPAPSTSWPVVFGPVKVRTTPPMTRTITTDATTHSLAEYMLHRGLRMRSILPPAADPGFFADINRMIL